MATTTKKATRKSSSASKSRARSSNGGAKRTQSKRTQSRSNSGARKTTSSRRNASRVDQVVGTAKQAADKAKGPAVAVGAAAAGLAGGLALKSRTGRRKVLGVPVPRSLKSGVDVKSVAKTVGAASQRVAKTSKSVSKDIERAGDKAERIGKILS
jgi:hypothetical protein